MTVRVNDPAVSGEIRLRGAVYDEYGGGGWKAGARTSVDLPAYIEDSVKEELTSGAIKGQVIPLTIMVDRNSVVGSVLFSPGEPLSASTPFQIEAPSSGLKTIQFGLRVGGSGTSNGALLWSVISHMAAAFVASTLHPPGDPIIVPLLGSNLTAAP